MPAFCSPVWSHLVFLHVLDVLLVLVELGGDCLILDEVITV